MFWGGRLTSHDWMPIGTQTAKKKSQLLVTTHHNTSSGGRIQQPYLRRSFEGKICSLQKKGVVWSVIFLGFWANWGKLNVKTATISSDRLKWDGRRSHTYHLLTWQKLFIVFGCLKNVVGDVGVVSKAEHLGIGLVISKPLVQSMDSSGSCKEW